MKNKIKVVYLQHVFLRLCIYQIEYLKNLIVVYIYTIVRYQYYLYIYNFKRFKLLHRRFVLRSNSNSLVYEALFFLNGDFRY